jgi:hypothetical protein
MPFKRRFKDTQRAPGDWHGVRSRERRSSPPPIAAVCGHPSRPLASLTGGWVWQTPFEDTRGPFYFGGGRLGVAKWSMAKGKSANDEGRTVNDSRTPFRVHGHPSWFEDTNSSEAS